MDTRLGIETGTFTDPIHVLARVGSGLGLDLANGLVDRLEAKGKPGGSNPLADAAKAFQRQAHDPAQVKDFILDLDAERIAREQDKGKPLTPLEERRAYADVARARQEEPAIRDKLYRPSEDEDKYKQPEPYRPPMPGEPEDPNAHMPLNAETDAASDSSDGGSAGAPDTTDSSGPRQSEPSTTNGDQQDGNSADSRNEPEKPKDSGTWTYYQDTGKLMGPDGKIHIGSCYSGRNEGNDKGKNNPDMEDKVDIGPIPTGDYDVTEIRDRTNEKKGSHYIYLNPDEKTRAKIKQDGRNPDDFRVHGDNSTADASKGCIVAPPNIRSQFKPGQKLRVVPHDPRPWN